MNEPAAGAILGLVEGIAEYLPISSSAHLEMAARLLDFTGPRASTFEVAIQLGAILAVVALYWKRYLGLIKPPPFMRFAGLRGILLLVLTSFPVCLTGLLFHSWIKQSLASPFSLVCAMVTGAVCMILVELKSGKPKCVTMDELTPKMALGIGLFQCLALWPGFSRSGATIIGGLCLGAKRAVAVEYSFIAAVPVMFAAAGYDLIRNAALFSMADLPLFGIGLLAAFLAALAGIRFFIDLLGRVTLIPFAMYRFLLAPVAWYILAG